MKLWTFLKVFLILVLSLVIAGSSVSAAQVSAPETSNSSICLYLFYSENCPHCDRVETFLQEKQGEYNLDVRKFEVRKNFNLLMNYSEGYDIPRSLQGKVPTGFIDGEYCVGAESCIELFQSKFQEKKGSGLDCPPTNPDETIKDGKIPLTIPGIAGLAIIDAVNPCALAVLIILLTAILSRYPDQKRKALSSGLAFSVAIFACYFLLGGLIVYGFKSLASLTSITHGLLFKALGAFAIAIGVLNLKDWLRHGAGGFVMEVPKSWRPRLKKIISKTTSPPGAFLTGVIVSLFLLPCTSGPYFVAGGLLSKMAFISALPWLVLYNLIFVVPMITITLFVYTGFASVESISSWKNENIQRLHLLAGLILIGLGTVLVLGLI